MTVWIQLGLIGGAVSALLLIADTWRRLISWTRKEQTRNEAVDAWTRHWTERGITTLRAIEEHEEERQLLKATAAAATGLDVRLKTIEPIVDHIRQQVDKIAGREDK
jgi:hypothetical protein